MHSSKISNRLFFSMLSTSKWTKMDYMHALYIMLCYCTTVCAIRLHGILLHWMDSENKNVKTAKKKKKYMWAMKRVCMQKIKMGPKHFFHCLTNINRPVSVCDYKRTEIFVWASLRLGNPVFRACMMVFLKKNVKICFKRLWCWWNIPFTKAAHKCQQLLKMWTKSEKGGKKMWSIVFSSIFFLMQIFDAVHSPWLSIFAKSFTILLTWYAQLLKKNHKSWNFIMIIFAWDGFFREIMKHSLSSFSVLV